jgi:hypothetical protein
MLLTAMLDESILASEYGRVEMRNDLWVRLNAGIEHFIVTWLVPRRVGKVMRLFFKIPVLSYRLGLDGVVLKSILILTTTGRKTGKRRQTALEHGYDLQQGEYFLMTGWGGKSDWYRNALANSHVEIRIRNDKKRRLFCHLFL